MVLGSSPVAVTSPSNFAPASSKEFLDIQATIECGFTLKRVRDMTRTYSYNLISILKNFSKVYENVIKNQLVPYFDKHFSPFILAYRKKLQHSTGSDLFARRMKKSRLDKNFAEDTVLMKLSKSFDCILHDVIIAKLAAYGLERENLRLIYSYLMGWKHCVKIINTYSDYNEIFSGVPQSSLFGPIFFNLSINELISSLR